MTDSPSFRRGKVLKIEEKIQAIKEQPLINIKETDLYSTVSIRLLKEVHIALRIISFKYRVSMSDMVREFVEKLVVGDKYLLNMISGMQERRKEEGFKSLINYEAESIYKILEQFESDRTNKKEANEKTLENSNKEEEKYDGIFDELDLGYE